MIEVVGVVVSRMPAPMVVGEVDVGDGRIAARSAGGLARPQH